MKKFVLSLLIQWFFSCAAFAQNGNVGIGASPAASAKLDISATDKGILIPRITKANRPAAPSEGLLIYQTDNTPGFYYYKGSLWTKLIDSSNISGSIIPFSSGNAATISFSGIGNTSTIVGFGNNAVVNHETNVIEISSTPNFAFVAPRSGILTAVSGFFSAATNQSLGAAVATVSVKLYESFTPGSILFSSTAVSANLSPAFTGNVTTGAAATGTLSGLAFPIVAGNRYILVFQLNSTVIFPLTNLTGYLSGAINIL